MNIIWRIDRDWQSIKLHTLDYKIPAQTFQTHPGELWTLIFQTVSFVLGERAERGDGHRR